MIVRMESILWQFAKLMCKKFNADHPDQLIGMNIAAAAALLAFEAYGHALEELDADGNSTWKATPKLLGATGLEPGPLIILGPKVH
jgi:hypothetical protein